MIKEEKKDLIDRRELYQKLVQKINKQYDGATLSSTLTFGEILEVFGDVSTQEELGAVWILDGSIWRCSWCKMSALESFGKSFPSKCCPYCGRRMKMEGSNGSKA